MMLYKQPDAIPTLQHDRTVHVAVGNSRNSKSWTNQTLSVQDFIGKIGHTVRTTETVDEYLAMGKRDQDEIKDVGGFVGGVLKGGSRSKHNVGNRQILTLDADYAKHDFLDTLQQRLKGCAYSVYSTHKHTPDKPRLRVIVYPDRAMLVDEYQAVMRKIADRVGIDQFDDTTYDVNRLMYWPSTPKDGEFVFRHNDAPMLCVDDVLAEYGPDEVWRDVTKWPTSSREDQKTERMFRRQADPLEKKGVVGAFCRVVSIYDALETHLEGIYRREGENRYSYTDGTTTNGVVIYDGRFAYSNHGTDPARGQTCNAFDIVRIHKFGHLDDGSATDLPTSKLPSYAEMMEYARGIKAVKQELIASGIDTSADEFDEFAVLDAGAGSGAGSGAEGGPQDDGWLAELQVADNGDIKTTFLNATLILANDPSVSAAMRFNEFSMSVERSKDAEPWSATDSYTVRKYIGRKYGCDFPEAKIEQAIEDRAHANSYHPVADYLESLRWDKTPRIESFFVDWLGAADNAYTREAALCWFAAAVYRVMEPGFKFDHAIVIGGEQGLGKSTLIEALAGRRWFGELSSFDPKVAMEEIGGKWLIEISEMGATNRHELEQQKSFLSATSTRVRPAYARHAVEYKRQCVFAGTTNQSEYLKDSTGNRRWWPIDCRVESIDVPGVRAIRDQLWAEAFMLYATGAPTTLSAEARRIANETQEDKREGDPWAGMIAEWLGRPAQASRYDTDGAMLSEFGGGDDGPRDRVCVLEIWQDCLKMPADPKPVDRRRLATIMDSMDGWERKATMRFGERFGRQKGWSRVTGSGPSEEYPDVPF